MDDHVLAHAFKTLAQSIDRATDLREKDLATKQDLVDVYHKLSEQIKAGAGISVEDQKLLDALLAREEARANKLEALDASLTPKT